MREPTKLKVRTYKSTDEEYAVIKKNAKRFAKGNVSEWVRTASMLEAPTKRIKNGK